MSTDPQNSHKGTNGVTSSDNPDKGTNGVMCAGGSAGKVNNGGDAIGSLISATSTIGVCSKIRTGGPPRVPPPNAA